ncbi:MAG TPA: hypothetical protein VK855_10735 [Thioalkalivibrio sp.]|nr:hypothetical protein [Thioalkalivibrio sp.]
MVVQGPHALDDRVQSDLGHVIARWRFGESERRAAVDVLEPVARPGGPRVASIPLDVIGVALLALGALVTWMGGQAMLPAELGVAALFAGGLLVMIRSLALVSGGFRRRRFLHGPPEVIIGDRGISAFGERTRWSNGPLGRRLEGASLIAVAGKPFLRFSYSHVSGRGSTQGQRVTGSVLVPVPHHHIADAEALASCVAETPTS